MRIVADQESCFGAGQCVMLRPDLFDQDDNDGTVIVLVDSVTAGDLPDLRTAVHYCPSRSLSLEAD